MGQLERYGLYVLVLVIFLILGVAIWGSEAPPVQAMASSSSIESSSTNGAERIVSALHVADEPPTPKRDVSVDFRGLFGAEPEPEPEAERRVATQPGLSDLEHLVASAPVEVDGTPETAPTKANKELPSLRKYVVQEGDILGEIAKRFLGKSTAWRAILKQNPTINPNRLKVGTTIRIPHTDAVLAQHGRPTRSDPKDRYIVQDGDNPSTISKRVYGTQKYASLLMKANGISDPRRLRAGKVLTVPKIEED